eukprot:13550884-Heterocapsa_arctica.AAC.1
MHAFGDDTPNAARQQWFLSPRYVEASRPKGSFSVLYQGVDPNEPNAMPKLTGWTKNQDVSTIGPAPEDLNAREEHLRFRLDCSTQWKKSGARIWDGMPE